MQAAQKNAASAIGLIEAEFRAAGAGGLDTPQHAANGMRALVALAEYLNGRPPELDDAAKRLSATITGAMGAIVAEVPHVAPERAYFALGGTSALAWRLALAPADGVGGDQVLAFDAIDHVILLADELSAVHRRRRIEARGNRLDRFIKTARAASAAHSSSTH